MERRLAALPSELLGRVSVAAIASTLASWTRPADAWLERCLARLRANRDIIGQWLAGAGAEAVSGAFLSDGTYLSWLDFRASRSWRRPRRPGSWNTRKVMLSAGTHFGPGGAGFARLNFATTPGLLEEILSRVARGSRSARRPCGAQKPGQNSPEEPGQQTRSAIGAEAS